MDIYKADPTRYELRVGSTVGAPLCPFGNKYKWIGYDLQRGKYVRFTTSVFKLLVLGYTSDLKEKIATAPTD